MRNAIALAYEYNASRLYYSDIQRGAIHTVRFNGSDHRVLLDRECPLWPHSCDYFNKTGQVRVGSRIVIAVKLF